MLFAFLIQALGLLETSVDAFGGDDWFLQGRELG